MPLIKRKSILVRVSDDGWMDLTREQVETINGAVDAFLKGYMASLARHIEEVPWPYNAKITAEIENF